MLSPDSAQFWLQIGTALVVVVVVRFVHRWLSVDDGKMDDDTRVYLKGSAADVVPRECKAMVNALESAPLLDDEAACAGVYSSFTVGLFRALILRMRSFTLSLAHLLTCSLTYYYLVITLRITAQMRGIIKERHLLYSSLLTDPAVLLRTRLLRLLSPIIYCPASSVFTMLAKTHSLYLLITRYLCHLPLTLYSYFSLPYQSRHGGCERRVVDAFYSAIQPVRRQRGCTGHRRTTNCSTGKPGIYHYII
jgi:hypothetical protein